LEIMVQAKMSPQVCFCMRASALYRKQQPERSVLNEKCCKRSGR
jgi:hypothetical protein